MELIQLNDIDKRNLLLALGYTIDEDGFIRTKEGEYYKSPYTNLKVRLKEAQILPKNSTIIIDSSIHASSEYLSEFIENDTSDSR